MQDTILIIDFGSQYTQLIARRVRELYVYSEVYPWDKCPQNLKNYKGVILSGSSFLLADEKAPTRNVLGMVKDLPLLGIGYGASLLLSLSGGKVIPAGKRDYKKDIIEKIDQQ